MDVNRRAGTIGRRVRLQIVIGGVRRFCYNGVMKDELDVQNMDVTMPLTIAVAGAFLLLGAAGILWYGYGASVALAMMAGDAFLNCF